MDDLRKFRELLDEEPPSDEEKERARQALLRHIAQSSTRGRRNRLLLLAAGGAGLVTLTVVAAIITLAPAQAAWSPVPNEPPDRELVVDARSRCADNLGLPETLPPVEVIDQRGNIAVVLFGERSEGGSSPNFVTCLLVSTEMGWQTAGVDDIDFEIAVTAGYAAPTTDSPITEAIVELDDGRLVQVSHRDGYYIVWWPAEIGLAGEIVEFRAPSGDVLVEIIADTTLVNSD